jgi:organic radical activating enzyme
MTISKNSLLSTLKRVEINLSDLCNRTCGFCPRHDRSLYKNSKEHMSLIDVELIARQLREIEYQGWIDLVGFSEPLLYKDLTTAIKILSSVSGAAIEINTNGDLLTKELLLELHSAGLTHLFVSMYDTDQSDYFTDMCSETDIVLTLRHHYDPKNNYGLNLVNRNYITDKKTLPLNISRPCNLPFYKIFIDHTGDYLSCSQDWAKTSKDTRKNIKELSIKDYWLDHLDLYRKHLSAGNREHLSPCCKCDIQGTLHGQLEHSKWSEYYLNN